MAIATATETSFADEVETEPDLEPDPELHLRGRSCRCPAANVKAYRDEDEWVCHTCGHPLSPRVARLRTLTTRNASRRQAIDPTPRTPNDPARQRPINERGLICGASGELVAHARRPASSAR
jgi:hypothetical protein